METLEIQKLIQQSRRQDSYAFSLLEIQDYVMTAQSRAMNVWAFALTTLLLLTALYFIWKKN